MSVRLLTLLLIVLTLPASAQDLTDRIDAYVSQYHAYDQFNGVILVAQSGEVIYRKGFGDANMAFDVPNTPETKFRIGSVTKQFTAALILQLVEAGEVDLQAPVTAYLPDYPAEPGGAVTVHQLLVHTSGIPSYTNLPGFMQDEIRDPYPVDSLIAVFSEMDLDFEPGTAWSYNNSGYILLGAIIERVTGQPYDVVLRERILDPLGLNDTGYDHYGTITEQLATGYVKTPGGYEHAPYLDTSLPYAAGMMYSTVDDLFAWDRALYGTGPFEEEATLALMVAPHAELPGNDGIQYGYGWFLHEEAIGDQTVRVVEHGGGIFGFITSFWRMPDDGHTIIVMDNTSQPNEPMTRGIAALLYGAEPEPPRRTVADVFGEVLEAEGLAAAEARYRALQAEEPAHIRFSEQAMNGLGYYYLRRGEIDTAIRIFELNVEAYPDAFNTYDSLGEALLAAGDRDRAIANYQKALDLNPASASARAALETLGVEAATPSVEVDTDLLERYVGQYALAPGFVITITREGSQLHAQASGQPRFPIYPRDDTTFYFDVVDAQITFTVEGEGPATGLTLYQNGQTMPAPRVEEGK